MIVKLILKNLFSYLFPLIILSPFLIMGIQIFIGVVFAEKKPSEPKAKIEKLDDRKFERPPFPHVGKPIPFSPVIISSKKS